MKRGIRSAVAAAALFVLGLLVPSNEARADSTLDIGRELMIPGTRVLVVEFYSLTCKPCMAAVPKWAALHAKYRSAGLRFVVVAASEDGDCTALPWSPDRRVCDVDDFHRTRLRVTKLPTAMAWSWDGKLLAKGHVKEIEAAVEEELRRMPRAVVKATAGDSRLVDVERLVRSELGRTGKIEAAATEAELKEIEAIQRASAKLAVEEGSGCEQGKQLGANSLLAVSLGSGANAKLTLQLRSAETGCSTGLGQALWDAKNVERTVQAAVAELISSIAKAPQLPGGASAEEVPTPAPTKRQDKISNATDTGWKPTSVDPVLVTFESQPSGARVELDGATLCAATPCKEMVEPGSHSVRMSAEKFVTKESTVRVDGEDQRVSWQLEANTGTVRLETGSVSGVPISVDGANAGKSPLRLELKAGPHRIEIKDRCFEYARADISVERGAEKRIDLAGVRRTAGLSVDLRDANGEPLRADVRVDGVVAGKTWKALTVPVCAKEAVVETAAGTWRSALALQEKETSRVTGSLQGQRSGGASPSRPVDTRVDCPSDTVDTGMLECACKDPSHRFSLNRWRCVARASFPDVPMTCAARTNECSGALWWKSCREACSAPLAWGAGPFDYDVARADTLSEISSLRRWVVAQPTDAEALLKLVKTESVMLADFIGQDLDAAVEGADDLAREDLTEMSCTAYDEVRDHAMALLALSDQRIAEHIKTESALERALESNFTDSKRVEHVFWSAHAMLNRQSLCAPPESLAAAARVMMAHVYKLRPDYKDYASRLTEGAVLSRMEVEAGCWDPRNPNRCGDRAKRARTIFDEVKQFTEGRSLVVQLNLATRYACRIGDKELFESSLREVLCRDLDGYPLEFSDDMEREAADCPELPKGRRVANAAPSELRLTNAIAQRRARRYLASKRLQEQGLGCSF